MVPESCRHFGEENPAAISNVPTCRFLSLVSSAPLAFPSLAISYDAFVPSTPSYIDHGTERPHEQGGVEGTKAQEDRGSEGKASSFTGTSERNRHLATLA